MKDELGIATNKIIEINTTNTITCCCCCASVYYENLKWTWDQRRLRSSYRPYPGHINARFRWLDGTLIQAQRKRALVLTFDWSRPFSSTNLSYYLYKINRDRKELSRTSNINSKNVHKIDILEKETKASERPTRSVFWKISSYQLIF